MGDRRKRALRVRFDDKLRLEFHGAKIMSDAGLLPFRELDEAFRLTEQGSTVLSGPRPGKNTQHTMLAMLRQGASGRMAGYEDVDDAERLRVDPAMRRVVSGRAKEKGAAFASEMSRFETEMLSSKENLTALTDLSGTWIDVVQECVPPVKLILNLDSSQSETYGDQQGPAYNGYFECMCYHALFLFNQYGDPERAMLRRGNHNSAKFWRRVLLPVIERYRDRDIHLLTRPVGRPSHSPKVFYESFWYQAQSWDHPRRVVAKVEWHWDELFPRVGFIVANMMADVAVPGELFAAILERIQRFGVPPPLVQRR